MAFTEQVLAPDIESVVVGQLHSHPIKTTPIELLDQFTEKYDVDPTLARAIIFCESAVYGNSMDVIEEYQFSISNPKSSASNPWQFLDSTWTSTMNRMGLPVDTPKDDPIISIHAGVWLLAQDGTSHWLESKSCWSRYA